MLVHTQYIALTEENFYAEVLNAKTLVLVDCWASWCGSFHQINPAYNELAIAFPGQVKIARLNLATAKKLAALYGIRVVPTLLLFQKGQLIERIIGSLEPQALMNQVNSLLVNQSSGRSCVACL